MMFERLVNVSSMTMSESWVNGGESGGGSRVKNSFRLGLRRC